MSDDVVTAAGSPDACSGAMYPGEPKMAPDSVRPRPSTTLLANPKSVMCGRPLSSSRMLAWLEVAVEDPPLVRVMHRRGDFGDEMSDGPRVLGRTRFGRGEATS